MFAGFNFGVSGASVLIGTVACGSVKHSATTPQTQLTCTLPAGTAQNVPVTVFQSNGEMSASNSWVSFAQCLPGSYVAANTLCSACGPGTYTSSQGLSACLQCTRAHACIRAHTYAQRTFTQAPLARLTTQVESVCARRARPGVIRRGSKQRLAWCVSMLLSFCSHSRV